MQLFNVNGFPKVKVPMEYGNRGNVPEPIACYYPQYGKGGEQQLIPEEKIMVKFNKVDLI